MDARREPRPKSRQDPRPASRLTPSPRDAERAMDASARCWLLHRWSRWTLYETVRPSRAIGPALRHVTAVAELRRRRHCVRCGRRDDRYVAQKPLPGDQPQLPAPRGFAEIGPSDRPASRRPDRAD